MKSSQKPLVSIIIPNFNYEKYLGLAIKSILAQSYSNWEVIVVDNGSSDDSLAVVESFEDSRIKAVSFQNDGVIARSRNFGAKLASGQLLAFLDSDDFWFREKLRIQIEAMDKNSADISFHSVKLVGTRLRRTFRVQSNSQFSVEGLLARGNPIVTSSVMVSKRAFDSLGGFTELPEHNSSEDYHLWLKAAAANLAFCPISTNLGAYRVHNSVSKSPGKWKAAETVTKEFQEHLTTDRRKKEMEGFISYSKGLEHFASREKAEALFEFKRTLNHAHFKFKWRSALRIVFLHLTPRA